MAYVVDSKPAWLAPINDNLYYDQDFARIISFFIFKSPCGTLSARRKSLNDYGWNTPWRKPYSLKKQLKRAASNYNILFSAENYDAVTAALQAADLDINFPSDIQRERICVYNNESNQFLSVFYHMRDAFAHGRFNIIVDENQEWTFIMEDVNNITKKEKRLGYTDSHRRVTARMIIKKQTLINWINLIEAGETEF